MFSINYKGEIVYTSYNFLGEREERILSKQDIAELLRNEKSVLYKLVQIYGISFGL